jgi:V/A-type H+-transporting ATPase subunit E
MTDTKLQEIIEKLKKHGVESGEEASRSIIEEANQKAGEILSKARSDAEAIVARANDEADKSRRQINSSMEIAASQLVTDLKRVIEENLLVLPLKEKLSEELNDTSFLRELMTTCVREYVNQPDRTDLTLLVPFEQQEKLAGFSMELIKSLPGKLEGKRLTLELKSNEVAFGFIIGTSDGVVRLDFTDEAFLELFLKYLLPRFHGLFKTIDIKGLENK